jgi:hypothetical protein
MADTADVWRRFREDSPPGWHNRLASRGNIMHRLAWLLIPLLLAACGGGKSTPTLSVVCSGPGSSQLNGATSIDVLGDDVNGRPTMNFPDPVSPGKTGSISVVPHGRCTITPQPPS